MAAADFTSLFTTLASVGGTVVAIVGGIAGTRHVQLQAQLEGGDVARHEAGLRVSLAEAGVEQAREETWPQAVKAVTSHDAFLDQLYVLVTDWRRNNRNPDLREAGVQQLARLLRPADTTVWQVQDDDDEVWEHIQRIWALASATLLDFDRGKPELTSETSIQSIWHGPPAAQELGCAHRPIVVYRIWRGLLQRAARDHLFNDHVVPRTPRDIREELEPEFARYAAVVHVAITQHVEAQRARVVTIAAAPALPSDLRADLVVLGIVALLSVVPPILYLTPGARTTPVTVGEALTVMILFFVALIIFLGHLGHRLKDLRRQHGGRTMAHLRPPDGIDRGT